MVQSPAIMRPSLKEAMLVLFPIPHQKHINSMCFKCSINTLQHALQAKQASKLGLEAWPKGKIYKLLFYLIGPSGLNQIWAYDQFKFQKYSVWNGLNG